MCIKPHYQALIKLKFRYYSFQSTINYANKNLKLKFTIAIKFSRNCLFMFIYFDNSISFSFEPASVQRNNSVIDGNFFQTLLFRFSRFVGRNSLSFAFISIVVNICCHQYQCVDQHRPRGLLTQARGQNYLSWNFSRRSCFNFYFGQYNIFRQTEISDYFLQEWDT